MWDDERTPEVDFLIGIDAAQGGADFTAIAVLQRTEPIAGDEATYAVTHLERWRSRETKRIPERVAVMYRRLEQVARDRHFEHYGTVLGADPDIRIAMDITGIGAFGSDPLRKAGFFPTEILIHGGDAVSHPEPDVYRVPKRDLAGAVAVLLESGRLKVANALPDAATLRAELENFRAKITLTGHDIYEAGSGEEWRAGAHDDLVLAVAVAAWLGESKPTPKLDPLIAAAWTDLPRL